jgi:hypothetical protein
MFASRAMRPHPLAPALVLAAALGASVLWIALRGGGEQPPSPAFAASAGAVPSAPGAEAASATAPERAGGSADADVGDAADDDAARSEVETRTTADAPVGPLVHVLLGREPAPGARVAWILLEDGQRAREREVRDRRMPADDVPDLDLAFRYGSRGAADDHGTLRLPPLRAQTVVAAQDGAGRFAAAIVHADRPHVLLRLRDDETLRLCVRDAMRTPQGDVALAVWAGKKFGDAGALWQGRTHADGTATVRHFQQARDGAQGERFAAVVAVPLRTPQALEFQGRPAPKEPVELVLPRTSPVEFAVVHQSGAPILAELGVSLLPVRDDKFALPLPLAPRFDTARATKDNGAPAAWLPHVDLGVELLPVLRLPGERRPVLLPPVTLPDPLQHPTGPEGGNPPAKLRAVLPPEFTVLVGSALLADGSPLAGAPVDWALSPTRGAPMTGSLATLADGRFDFVLRNRDPSQTWSLVLRTGADGAVLTADLKPQGLPPGERRMLGAITLRPAPLLAKGRVHDDRGEPVANASVVLQVLVPGKRGDEWQDAALLRTGSAQDGTFELVGNAPEHALRVSVEAAGHLPWSSPPLRPGAELEAILVRQGVLVGTVRLPDWLPPNAATLQLTTAYEPRREASLTLPQKGPFRLGGLVPDTYDARLTIRNLPHPLQVLAPVRIEPGENRDPQLDPFDLAASLFRYRLRAVGPGGRPLADFDGPIVWKTTSPRGEPATIGFRWQKGRAELITGASFLEFTTVGQGYLPAKVSVPAGDNDVYLQPVQPVIIDLPGLRALCGPDRAIRVSLIRQGDTGLPEGLGGVDQRSGQGFSYPRWYLGRSGGGWLSPDDRAEAIVSMNGTHDIVLRLYADQRRDGPQESMPLGRLDAVVDGQAPQVHRASFDAARVTAALQHLDQQLRAAAAQGSR